MTFSCGNNVDPTAALLFCSGVVLMNDSLVAIFLIELVLFLFFDINADDFSLMFWLIQIFFVCSLEHMARNIYNMVGRALR